MIQIVAAVPGRKNRRERPPAAFHINELALRHTIISLDIRQVIIVGRIIAGRDPGRETHADVQAEDRLGLRAAANQECTEYSC
jgi:hypothetical protein